ncbi:hypothetical protein MTQ01_02045 [Streptomyces sp. XM4193]|uniref:sporulation-delaying protein SdpB family protein n=1 Tax=Streptomyces sp. XM4193 TaxID=2929782 RepID=UPI001FF976D0|nr:sporulation-delaying protein SdpB family protein [Streptomyces sp. XM4193]MCK1794823.1 hypothetical protein [Streptomyces sp. XM4193]
MTGTAVDRARAVRTRWHAWRDDRIRSMLRHSVHNRVTGLARTLLALSTAATLLFTPPEHLMYVGPERTSGRLCGGFNGDIGLFCLAPADRMEWARWLAVAVLLVVASGWRPRWTAIPHWWISFSVFATSNVMEGGDQVAAITTLLLVPICLTDPRRLHWDRSTAPARSAAAHAVGAITAHLALRLIWAQACVIYLQASVSKLGGDEWRDGTTVWYWATSGSFGVPGALDGPVSRLFAQGWAVAGATWGTLVVEFALAWCLAAGRFPRRVGLVCGLALHASIAVLLGLPAFSLIMGALLLLYLVRPEDTPTARPGTSADADADADADAGTGTGTSAGTDAGTSAGTGADARIAAEDGGPVPSAGVRPSGADVSGTSSGYEPLTTHTGRPG